MSEPAKPGILDRLRARFGWLDHIIRAYRRFDDRNGGFFAAGLTYYTIFALFPLLMVGFAVVGFALSRRPELLNEIDGHIRAEVPSQFGQQLIELIDSAIRARTSIGVIGLTTAAWAGLGWMSHLRAALTEMWWDQPVDSKGYVRGKLSDSLAILGTFLVLLATLALSALGHARPMAAVLRWLHIPNYSVFGVIFQVASIFVSLLVSWLLFTWMIARLPRKSVSLVASMRAGLIAAVGFELFKQVGSIYLQKVLGSPAGATFGPVLGLMVFANITAYLLLFSAAWAATASQDPKAIPVEPPAPAVISPRVVDEGLSLRQALTAMAVGAVGALTFSRLTHRRR
ncbi:inner membrane protein YhjD [Mycobacterium conspicuum]|uniref:Inner membrane protein YhjD n=1 Tax=Mycobacterium conspicuum TaxID=44010 RepID=A0A1X1T445_9MYCO|nr:inner membrane protein YhjD [Mycobacterium conspicuum]ORV39292.1 inner membrane protein YhjD [Mycobacterium conspicuum]BBZ37725.1 inner membrane protein YhjD [Mycobacterium conspicuum]